MSKNRATDSTRMMLNWNVNTAPHGLYTVNVCNMLSSSCSNVTSSCSMAIRVYLLQPIDETKLVNLLPVLPKDPYNLPPVRSLKALTIVRFRTGTHGPASRRVCSEVEDSGVVVFLPLA